MAVGTSLNPRYNQYHCVSSPGDGESLAAKLALAMPLLGLSRWLWSSHFKELKERNMGVVLDFGYHSLFFGSHFLAQRVINQVD